MEQGTTSRIIVQSFLSIPLMFAYSLVALQTSYRHEKEELPQVHSK